MGYDRCQAADARADLGVHIAVRRVGMEDAVDERAHAAWQQPHVGHVRRALLDDVHVADALFLKKGAHLVDLEPDHTLRAEAPRELGTRAIVPFETGVQHVRGQSKAALAKVCVIVDGHLRASLAHRIGPEGDALAQPRSPWTAIATAAACAACAATASTTSAAATGTAPTTAASAAAAHAAHVDGVAGVATAVTAITIAVNGSFGTVNGSFGT